MDDKKIKLAVKVAKEFIALVDEMVTEEKERVCVLDGRTYGQYPSPKHRGAVRRRSMDLARALADMRKPQ